MRFLTIAAFLDEGHDDVLGSHEGQLLRDAAGYNLGVHYQSLRDVLQRGEDDVGSQERFWQRDATICAAESEIFVLDCVSQSLDYRRWEKSHERTCRPVSSRTTVRWRS